MNDQGQIYVQPAASGGQQGARQPSTGTAVLYAPVTAVTADTGAAHYPKFFEKRLLTGKVKMSLDLNGSQDVLHISEEVHDTPWSPPLLSSSPSLSCEFLPRLSSEHAFQQQGLPLRQISSNDTVSTEHTTVNDNNDAAFTPPALDSQTSQTSGYDVFLHEEDSALDSARQVSDV